MYSQAILIKKWILALLCLSLIACGGSKEFSVPEKLKDTKPPGVEEFFPTEEDSSNFEVDYKVEIIFSELMNLDSLSAEKGVQLFSGKFEQDTNVDLEPRDALFDFSVVPIEGRDLITDNKIQIPATKLRLTHLSGRFALNTNYTVSIDYPARDLAPDDLSTRDIDERNFITSASTVDFTTEKGEWKAKSNVPNISIENPGTPQEAPANREENRFSPTLVSNKKGDSFLFWRQEVSPGINQLWVSRYLANKKQWSMLDISQQVCNSTICANSMPVNADLTTSVIEYDVSINEQGQLAVVWSQIEPTSGFVTIWARLYDSAQWLEITDIADDGLMTRTGDADSPQVEIDKNGNVVSIWRQHENAKANSRIKTNIYKLDNSSLLMSDGQWIEAPSYIDNSAQALSNSPILEMNSSGLTIAVWAQKESNDYAIYSNHLRLYQQDDWDWVQPVTLDVNTKILSSPKLGVDNNGDAIAIWLKHDGQINNLWYSRFVGSWGSASLVERSRLGDVSFPAITFSQDRRALVSWVQENKATNMKQLVSRFFDITSSMGGWSAEKFFMPSSFVAKPTATFDREGNAVIFWQEGLTSGNINVSYYSNPGKVWGTPIVLSNLGNSVSVVPLFEDGRFLSIWEERDLENSSFKLKSALYSD